MSTRRNVKAETSEKPVDNADTDASAVVEKPKAQAVQVPGAVIAKLLMFTLAMIAGPLGTYYISITRLFIGNATVAGALAAVAANAVLIAYVIVAMSEDDADSKEKKSQ
ncbi:hypothetical protein BZA77DRAFT_330551 [Pyronema omphalodes]|nr:hypothetical protein BZA77DRAFT_330551 [Pyronema omphalodes]